MSKKDDPKLLAQLQLWNPKESESSLRTTLLYTNMTAKAVYDALVEKRWSTESLPTVRTISNILSRQDYRLRTVAKTKSKKTAETDAIFENVRQINTLADADTETLRISIDTKATVHVGEYSRGERRVALRRSRHWIMICTPKRSWCLAAYWSQSPADRFYFLAQ